MPDLRVTDTRTGKVVPLEPRDPGKVGIYACGPTVYNRIHIGNARPFVVFSLLKRFLKHEGLDAQLVINVTDVNDKIYAAANARGIPSGQLAEEMTAHYRADTDLLGLGRPDHEPLATETIGPIVDLIAALVENGSAYESEGDVYFRVRSDAQYGALSHRDVEQMDQGEGGEGLDRKEDPLDFALWKGEKEGEDTSWDSPWGRGRPGWHIECSAMAEEILGVGFDIHGGGSDLVFPHHENEAAQTRCGRGEELARVWMHNGMLQLGGEKMSKSVGNIDLLADAVERWGRDTLVLFFSTARYRQPIQYTDDALGAARARVEGIREAGRRLVGGEDSPEDLVPLRDRFFDALRDDFNTPAALAVLAEWIGEANKREGVGDGHLREMLEVLGLENLLDAGREPGAEDLALLEQRQAARAAKDFAEADRLRDELTARGWQVRDGAGGASLVPVES
ncbi:MAG TPA: cysteine--tRNA ligase [Solirubrobacteraceae bacterium]|nr:cysteine--tRNA ligase [Solirubrobacteraceae bacterium]